ARWTGTPPCRRAWERSVATRWLGRRVRTLIRRGCRWWWWDRGRTRKAWPGCRSDRSSIARPRRRASPHGRRRRPHPLPAEPGRGLSKDGGATPRASLGVPLVGGTERRTPSGEEDRDDHGTAPRPAHRSRPPGGGRRRGQAPVLQGGAIGARHRAGGRGGG